MNIQSNHMCRVMVGLLLCGTACTHYVQIDVSDVQAYDEVRVTTNDIDGRLLLNPALDDGQLRGYPSEHARSGGDLWVIPVDEVAEVEAKQANTVGTVSLVALGVGIAAAIISVVDWDNSDTL